MFGEAGGSAEAFAGDAVEQGEDEAAEGATSGEAAVGWGVQLACGLGFALFGVMRCQNDAAEVNQMQHSLFFGVI